MTDTTMQPTRRMVIAPAVQVARLFIRESGYNPSECRIATKLDHLQGVRLDQWEVWFLQRAWPCRTHRDVECMEEMMAYARYAGADIRRWWT